MSPSLRPHLSQGALGLYRNYRSATMIGPNKVMTVSEVSAYLRVHPSTIYRLLKKHRIPAFRVGSEWRFNIEDLELWRLEKERAGDM